MAEQILFTVAENVLSAVTSLAVEEVSLVWGLESDLRKLETTLSAIKAVLLDAEEKQTTNHLINHWLRRLKQVLYDAEDVLDDFAYQLLRKKVVKTNGGFNRKVRHFFSSSNPAVYRLKIGHRIKNLRLRLDEIAVHKAQFNLERLDIGPSVHLPEREMTHSYVKSSDIIGREGDLKAIVKFLTDSHRGHAGDDNVAVIPIVGMGGLGKTAVAKMVFNDPRVVNHFNSKLWVCLGDMKEFDVNQVMKKIGGEMDVAENSNPQHLQQVIRDNMQGKSLLLVLDDVWDVSRDKWLNLKSLLTSCSETKIVVTTRISSVAKCVGGTAHNLPGLPHEECVSLFKKLAFDHEAEVDKELMKIGEDIVKKCKGVPLAIRILGSFLFSKSNKNEWLLVRDSSIWELPESQRSILPVLKFSYDHLPYHLKQCFVYCSIFPEDYKFEARFLISFWMAHGLLQSSKKNQEPEDVGKNYIDELLSRGFFQDREEALPFGWSFKMHDLVRDLACSLGQEEFANITDSCKSISKSVKHWYCPADEIPADSTSNVVRSLILSEDNAFNLSSKTMVLNVFSKFKYLRFLRFDRGCNEVPDTIGDLKHLRYLDLSRHAIMSRLPDSICKLHNLQTLILECIFLEELPKNIGELINLRYLWISTLQKDLPANNRIECLPSLQFLAFRRCINLRTLFEKSEDVSSSFRTLIVWDCANLVSLFSLSGFTTRKYSLTALEVLYITVCPNLNLNYKIGKDRDSQYLHLPRLRWLELGWLPQLEHFPEWIHGCATTLQFLRIEGCNNLKALPEWLPNLTSLRTLEITICPQLLRLPQGMERLTNLKQLKIVNCGELSRRCKKETGEDWPKIAHVPSISIISEFD